MTLFILLWSIWNTIDCFIWRFRDKQLDLNFLIDSLNCALSTNHDVSCRSFFCLSFFCGFFLLYLGGIWHLVYLAWQSLVVGLEFRVLLFLSQETDLKFNDLLLFDFKLWFKFLKIALIDFLYLFLVLSLFVKALKLFLTLRLEHSYSDVFFL